MTQPTTSWLQRALQWARLLPTSEAPPSPEPSSASVSGAQWLDPSISVSMSGYAAFPWVYRCVTVISQDTASLPLYVERSRRGGRSEVVYDHPALAMLRRPSPGVSGHALRAQLAVDLVASGNAYLWRTSGGHLRRLHPAALTVEVDHGSETVTGYMYRGLSGQRRIAPRDIAHIRGPSWADTIAQATGYSATAALNGTLRIEDSAARQARIAAAKGRIQTLFSPRGDDGISAPSLKRLKDAWSAAEREGSTTFFLSEAVKADPLSYSARDSQLIELRAQNREDVCAAFGVPPTIAGIPGANHGTAREEARGYWERTIQPVTRMFDEAIAKLLPLADGEEIRHDFSAVVALQVARTDQFSQAGMLVAQFGATPREALDYLGFTDAPAGDVGAGGRPVGRDPSEEPRDEVFTAALRILVERGRGRPIAEIRGALSLLGAEETPGLDEAAAMIHYGDTCADPGGVVRMAHVVGALLTT
jgi:HK97 family phage portal protein